MAASMSSRNQPTSANSSDARSESSQAEESPIPLPGKGWKSYIPPFSLLLIFILISSVAYAIRTIFSGVGGLSAEVLYFVAMLWIIFWPASRYRINLYPLAQYFHRTMVESFHRYSAFFDVAERTARYLEPRCSREFVISGITYSCVALALFLDSNATLEGQRNLAICAWVILLWQLSGETKAVRIQVAIAIAFATIGEHFASPFMGGYIYRFDNVPAYVPPGHGMVYLTAVAMARTPFFSRNKTAITAVVLVTGTLWSVYGITIAARGDAVGALLFTVFFIFVFVGRSPLVYLAAFFITTWLEILGTHWGTWRWVVIDPVLSLPQGNPPSGVAAWYCLVDAVALGGAAYVLGWLESAKQRLRLAVQRR
ncbi:MAG: hypothetical protein V3V31_05650 [Methylococcales bacterium]